MRRYDYQYVHNNRYIRARVRRHRNVLQRRRRNSLILSQPHQFNISESEMFVLCKTNWSVWLHQAVYELYRQKHHGKARSKLTNENEALLQNLVQKMYSVSYNMNYGTRHVLRCNESIVKVLTMMQQEKLVTMADLVSTFLRSQVGCQLISTFQHQTR